VTVGLCGNQNGIPHPSLLVKGLVRYRSFWVELGILVRTIPISTGKGGAKLLIGTGQANLRKMRNKALLQEPNREKEYKHSRDSITPAQDKMIVAHQFTHGPSHSVVYAGLQDAKLYPAVRAYDANLALLD
jgi:hypothetical protein